MVKFMFFSLLLTIASGCGNNVVSTEGKEQSKDINKNSPKDNGKEDDANNILADFQKKDNKYVIASNKITHGENATLFEALCMANGNFQITLEFSQNTELGAFSCNNKNAHFNYDAKAAPGGLWLKLKDFKFDDEKQKTFMWGINKYATADALMASEWFYNPQKNTIESIVSFLPSQLKNIKADFSKGTLLCPNGEETKVEEAHQCWGTEAKDQVQLSYMQFTSEN